LNIFGLTFDVSDTLSAISAFGTMLLTLPILLIYSRQAKIMETQTELSKRQQQFMEESDFPLPTVAIEYINGEVELHGGYADNNNPIQHFYKKRFNMTIYNNSKYLLRIQNIQVIIPSEYRETKKSSPLLEGVELHNNDILPHSKWCSKEHAHLWMREQYQFYLTELTNKVATITFKLSYYHPLSNQLLFVNVEKEWK